MLIARVSPSEGSDGCTNMTIMTTMMMMLIVDDDDDDGWSMLQDRLSQSALHLHRLHGTERQKENC